MRIYEEWHTPRMRKCDTWWWRSTHPTKCVAHLEKVQHIVSSLTHLRVLHINMNYMHHICIMICQPIWAEDSWALNVLNTVTSIPPYCCYPTVPTFLASAHCHVHISSCCATTTTQRRHRHHRQRRQWGMGTETTAKGLETSIFFFLLLLCNNYYPTQRRVNKRRPSSRPIYEEWELETTRLEPK